MAHGGGVVGEGGCTKVCGLGGKGEVEEEVTVVAVALLSSNLAFNLALYKSLRRMTVDIVFSADV